MLPEIWGGGGLHTAGRRASIDLWLERLQSDDIIGSFVSMVGVSCLHVWCRWSRSLQQDELLVPALVVVYIKGTQCNVGKQK